jgi:isoleucyl-tRNA synthetase
VRLVAAMLRHSFRVLQLGLQHGLEPFSPVDDAGCFTAEAGAEFQGLAVLDEGNAAVIQALKRAGALLKVRHMPSGWLTRLLAAPAPATACRVTNWCAHVDRIHDLRLLDMFVHASVATD